MASTKVAVVTGANKGIGFAIVKGLCEQFSGVVYLTSRDATRGKNAVAELENLGLKPEFYQLDISDQESIDRFKEHIQNQHGGIDILINNAAIAYKFEATDPFAEQAVNTISVNYFDFLRVSNSLFPLLRPNARVVNVSSCAAHLATRIPNPEFRAKLANPNITQHDVSEIMLEFVDSAKLGRHLKDGWGHSSYNIAKAGMCAVTFLQQKYFDADKTRSGIWVNTVHPGYVKTDMTSHRGSLTIEQGADSSIYLALLPSEGQVIKGKYVWFNRSIVDWRGETIPTKM